MPNIRSSRGDRSVGYADDVTYLGYGKFKVSETAEEEAVRVNNTIMKCVGFIGEVAGGGEAENEGDLLGTGFFISVPSSIPGRNFQAFVTAKHLVTALGDRKFYVLVNKKKGGVTRFEGLGDHWWLHPTDLTADVAVLMVEPQKGADYLCVPDSAFITPEVLQQNKVGAGDEVFTTGLFTYAPGVKKNIPIVRHGNIAMMPDEQIQTELGYANVYLVEARSIGGLSGSPVFVRETVGFKMKPDQGSEEVPTHALGRTHLLGMMHGHWDIQESELNNPYFSQDSKRGVNIGIGIVVPAVKILEIMNIPELVTARREADERIMKERTPATD